MAKTAKARTAAPAPAAPDSVGTLPFWKSKTLEEMTGEEWESLCDGCGRCCLVKLEDEDTQKVYFTEVGCKLFQSATCRCADYKNRQSKVADCIRLTPHEVRTLTWLPPTCGYRLVRDGEDLMWWHQLMSGSTDTVHEAGVSARGKVKASEEDVPEDDLIDYIAAWPTNVPAKAKRKP